MKKYYFLLLFIVSSNILAQAQEIKWSKTFDFRKVYYEEIRSKLGAPGHDIVTITEDNIWIIQDSKRYLTRKSKNKEWLNVTCLDRNSLELESFNVLEFKNYFNSDYKYLETIPLGSRLFVVFLKKDDKKSEVIVRRLNRGENSLSLSKNDIKVGMMESQSLFKETFDLSMYLTDNSKDRNFGVIYSAAESEEVKGFNHNFTLYNRDNDEWFSFTYTNEELKKFEPQSVHVNDFGNVALLGKNKKEWFLIKMDKEGTFKTTEISFGKDDIQHIQMIFIAENRLLLIGDMEEKLYIQFISKEKASSPQRIEFERSFITELWKDNLKKEAMENPKKDVFIRYFYVSKTDMWSLNDGSVIVVCPVKHIVGLQKPGYNKNNDQAGTAKAYIAMKLDQNGSIVWKRNIYVNAHEYPSQWDRNVSFKQEFFFNGHTLYGIFNEVDKHPLHRTTLIRIDQKGVLMQRKLGEFDKKEMSIKPEYCFDINKEEIFLYQFEKKGQQYGILNVKQ